MVNLTQRIERARFRAFCMVLAFMNLTQRIESFFAPVVSKLADANLTQRIESY